MGDNAAVVKCGVVGRFFLFLWRDDFVLFVGLINSRR